jgi:hypothetical protein
MGHEITGDPIIRVVQQNSHSFVSISRIVSLVP